MVVPNNHGFPTNNDHFGVFWGYHHLRKPPYKCICLLYIFTVIYIYRYEMDMKWKRVEKELDSTFFLPK